MFRFKFEDAIGISAGSITDKVENDRVARFKPVRYTYRGGIEGNGFKFFNINRSFGFTDKGKDFGNKLLIGL